MTLIQSVDRRPFDLSADPSVSTNRFTFASFAMEALFFNSHSGYLEGIIRGFKAGLISQTQYSNLTQCETLDGELANEVQS